MSGNGRHRRARQAPAIIVAAGVTGSAIAIPLLAAASASAADASTWDKVAACESGGQWSANLSNGYFGGLQISQDTWDQFGGNDYANRPDLATRTQQIAVAEKILSGQGSGTWASCADTAGLPKAKTGSGSDGSSDGGTLGDVLGGLLGGSHGSGGSDGSDGSSATDPAGAPAPGATDGSATPDPSGSSDTPGADATSGDQATGSVDPSATPSGSASPGSSDSAHGRGHGSPSTSGGKHRASTAQTPSTDDGGFPLSVSHDNSGGVESGSATGGAVGSSDLPGVVRDSGASPLIRVPFAPQYASGTHTGGEPRSLWQFPDEAAWAGQGAASSADPANGAPAATGTPSGALGTPGVPGGAGVPTVPGVNGTAAGTAPGGAGGSGTTAADPSGSAASAGKHRGGAATEASGTPATPETGSDSQNGQFGRHAVSGDTSSHDASGATGSDASYTVRAGDSLSGIAASRRVDGGWRALYEANKAALGSDPNRIVPGQSLDLTVN